MEKPEGGRIDGKLFWQWTKENGHRISCGQAKRRFSNHYIIRWASESCLLFAVRAGRPRRRLNQSLFVYSRSYVNIALFEAHLSGKVPVPGEALGSGKTRWFINRTRWARVADRSGVPAGWRGRLRVSADDGLANEFIIRV